ncbi:serine hydrolase domain-containing protein [Aureimonas ureilytica]|uniref:serine hydrolase domain-containing protein n=1 Tax=Aureimonas ureilytica TaxID=401562 RepID=UPI00036B7584|nr:serine hydrolase domain-containing protein [Aureimonas ureilytica]
MIRTERIDRVIDEAIASRRLVGAVVMVAEKGAITYRRAAGLADREAGVPMREDTLFRAASLTKPLVASTILALGDKGRLDLSDPVTVALPFFRPKLADGREPTITLAQLLTHTAGLTYSYPRDPSITFGLQNVEDALEDTLQRIARQPLAFEPGTAWAYSMATDVLGAVAARVNGSTLGQAVREHVTGPLGMSDTDFPPVRTERLAVPYGDGEAEPVRMGEPHRMTSPWGSELTFSPSRILNPAAFQSGGAGMATTASDFMRFLLAVEAGGAPILQRETVARALANQTGAIEQAPGKRFGYLGSLTVDPAEAGLPWPAGTTSWGGIYGHIWSIDPLSEISMVSLTNTALYGGEGAFPQALREAIYAP